MNTEDDKVIGFDKENAVLAFCISEKIIVIQLACLTLDHVIVLQIGRIKQPCQTIMKLETMLAWDDVAFAGVQINGDVAGLKKITKNFHCVIWS